MPTTSLDPWVQAGGPAHTSAAWGWGLRGRCTVGKEALPKGPACTGAGRCCAPDSLPEAEQCSPHGLTSASAPQGLAVVVRVVAGSAVYPGAQVLFPAYCCGCVTETLCPGRPLVGTMVSSSRLHRSWPCGPAQLGGLLCLEEQYVHGWGASWSAHPRAGRWGVGRAGGACMVAQQTMSQPAGLAWD